MLVGSGHDEIDFRMWNPAGLDNVLDSCLLTQLANNRKFSAQTRRNEDLRQISVKHQLYFKAHGLDLRRLAAIPVGMTAVCLDNFQQLPLSH